MTNLACTRLGRLFQHKLNGVGINRFFLCEEKNMKYGVIFRKYFSKEILKVPQLGDSITEGTLNTWKKNVGDYVKADETVAVIDTDKVSVDINTKKSGVISKTFANPGDVILVGSDLCEIDTDGKPNDGKSGTDGSKDNGQHHGGSQQNKSAVGFKEAEKKEKNKTEQKEIVSEKKKEVKIKEEGKKKEIIREEILTAQSAAFQRTEKRVKMLPIRKRIAERLKQSQNTCALLTTFNECDMSKAMILRNELKELFQKKYNCKLGFVSLFLYASTLALKQMPNVNAFIENDEIVYKNYIDISVAVATAAGLTVPVIRNCQSKKIHELEQSLAELAEKARGNKLTLEDFTDGTFTISNGGVFGSMLSTPIVNMPQSAILGMHAIKNRAVVVDSEIVVRPIMYLALTYDHRLLDGRDAVQFLCLIRDYIENPNRMLIE